MALGRLLTGVLVLPVAVAIWTAAPRAQVSVPCSPVPAPAVLASDWLNYGHGYEEATFYKDKAGRVHLQGLIRSQTFASLIAVLPEHCRPAHRLIAGGNVHTRNARVDILPNGQVHYISGQTFDWLSLSGISFHTRDGGTGSKGSLQLAAGWREYGGDYGPAVSYRGARLVSAHGLLDGETGEIGAFVRNNDQPQTGRHIFTVMKGGFPARVDVLADGRIFHIAGGGSAWLSLSGVSFARPNVPTEPLELLSGWVPYGFDYAEPAAYRDATGRCHLQGVVRSGSWSYIARMPEGCYPAGRLVFSANNHANVARLDVLTNGYIVWSGGSQDHGWVSLSGISFYPS